VKGELTVDGKQFWLGMAILGICGFFYFRDSKAPYQRPRTRSNMNLTPYLALPAVAASVMKFQADADWDSKLGKYPSIATTLRYQEVLSGPQKHPIVFHGLLKDVWKEGQTYLVEFDEPSTFVTFRLKCSAAQADMLASSEMPIAEHYIVIATIEKVRTLKSPEINPGEADEDSRSLPEIEIGEDKVATGIGLDFIQTSKKH
jgi:hypothetical protein